MKEDINKNYNDEEFKKKCNFTRIKIIEEIDRVKEEEEKKKAEEEQKKLLIGLQCYLMTNEIHFALFFVKIILLFWLLSFSSNINSSNFIF